jgi:hypothetical protein
MGTSNPPASRAYTVGSPSLLMGGLIPIFMSSAPGTLLRAGLLGAAKSSG